MVVSASMTSWSNRTAWQRFLNSSKFNCVSPVLSNLIIFSSKYSSDGSNPFLKWKMILFQKWVRFKIWSDPGVRSKVGGPKGRKWTVSQKWTVTRKWTTHPKVDSFEPKWTVIDQSGRSFDYKWMIQEFWRLKVDRPKVTLTLLWKLH